MSRRAYLTSTDRAALARMVREHGAAAVRETLGRAEAIATEERESRHEHDDACAEALVTGGNW